MKKIKQLLSLFIILLAAPQVMAQVISVCAGEDSVRLRLENYQYGKITWMRSYDNENWEIIENATDTVYKFLPEESMYYRAQVVFGDCEPVYSATSYVQTLPKPFAGTDKTLSIGAGIYLSASAEPGVIGRWDILSGIGGVLADDTSAYSFFYGTDTTYQLRWTMTNACGSRSDTLKIRYVETIYYDDIVYVDSTDQILSDSAERVNGLYRIIFSDPSVVVSDTSVLIGSMANPFFEKVEHVQMSGDTCIMETRLATLDDILVYGVLNATEVHYIDTVRHAPMPYILLNHFPTRTELQIPEIRNGHYRIVDGEEMRDGDNMFEYTIYDMNFHISHTIITFSGGRYMRIIPNLQHEFWEEDGERHFKFGFENATLKIGEWGDVTIGGAIPIPLAKCTIPHTVAGIPMYACIKPYLSIDGQCHFTYDHNSTYKFNALLKYHQNSDNEYTLNFRKESSAGSFEFSGNVEVKLGLTFHEDVAGGFFIFDTLGPYVDVALCASFSMCEASPYTAPKVFKLYPKIKVGAKASLRWKIPKLFKGVDLYYEYSFPPVIHWKNPYRIIPEFGDFQIFRGDEWLQHRIGVSVENLWGKPSVSTKVHFVPEPGCGEVENEWVETDENGLAQTRWKPSMSGADVQRLGVEVLGCSNHILGSPVYFQTGRDLCSRDNLKVTAAPRKYCPEDQDCPEDVVCITLKDNTYPLDRYMYSWEGDVYYYSSSPVCKPRNDPNDNSVYVFYVKNPDECVYTGVYVDRPSDCSGFSLNYTVEDNRIKLSASNGRAPYFYKKDGLSFGNSNSLGTMEFQEVDPGVHVFSVTDYNNCTVEKIINIGVPISISFRPNCTDHTGTMPNQGIYCNVATSLQPNAFVRDGYSFIGWNTRSDGSGTAYADMAAVTLTDNTTLYAQWGNAVHRLILHTNGGQGSDMTFDVECGEFFTLPQMADSHPCLTFREWNTRSDGMGDDYRDQATILLCAEMELYAIWDSVVAGTVFFYPNGADECGTMQQRFYTCYPKELLSYNCEYQYHVFTGWNTRANGSGTSYNDRQIIEPSGNMQLYAQWRDANMCTVTFNANGGIGDFAPITGYESVTVQLPAEIPTREDRHFLCWNTAADGSGVSYNPGSYLRLSQDITLFAQWSRHFYTVSFDANGGVGTMEPQIFYQDSAARINPNTFRWIPGINYFANWNTQADGNGTSYHDQEAIIVTDNITLYAQWTSDYRRVSCVVQEYNGNETIENGRLTRVRDHEGNVYPVVQMNNNSCWLRTNVQVTTSPSSGATLRRAAGYLYDWYAATDTGTTRGICPFGWHIPTRSEWNNGVTNCTSNGYSVYLAGDGWTQSTVSNSPGDYSNESRNYTNFSILPTGQYYSGEGVSGIGTEAWFWLGGGINSSSYAPCVGYSYQSVPPNYLSAHGLCFCFAVRCVRD